jgi:hypothetical protein
LKRLANKVYGWATFEGIKEAAKKCGTKLIAGVDDGIEQVFDSNLTPAEKDPAVENKDDLIKDEVSQAADKVVQDADFNTQEKPDKVEASEKKAQWEQTPTEESLGDVYQDLGVQKSEADQVIEKLMNALNQPGKDTQEAMADVYNILGIQRGGNKKESGVDDGIETPTREQPDAKPESALSDNDKNHKEDLDKPADDVRDSADLNYKHKIEADIKKLYAAKAEKQVQEKIANFTKTFIKCMKIASKRMSKNYDEHPYKAASMEVLMSNLFEDMSEDDAARITEIIASKGHDQFVDLLLERTADLMKRSADYLEDMDKDLDNLMVKPVEVEEKVAKNASTGSEDLKKVASEGNFSLNAGTQATRSSENSTHVGGIRAALSGLDLSMKSEYLRSRVTR